MLALPRVPEKETRSGARGELAPDGMWEAVIPPPAPGRYKGTPHGLLASQLLISRGKTGPGRPCLGCARRQFLDSVPRSALAAGLVWSHSAGIPFPRRTNLLAEDNQLAHRRQPAHSSKTTSLLIEDGRLILHCPACGQAIPFLSPRSILAPGVWHSASAIALGHFQCDPPPQGHHQNRPLTSARIFLLGRTKCLGMICNEYASFPLSLGGVSNYVDMFTGGWQDRRREGLEDLEPRYRLS